MSTLCFPNVLNSESTEFDLIFNPSQNGYNAYIIDYDVPSTFTDDHTIITSVDNLTNKVYGVGFDLCGKGAWYTDTGNTTIRTSASTSYTGYFPFYNTLGGCWQGHVLITIETNGIRKTFKIKQESSFRPIKFIIKHQASAGLSFNAPALVNNELGSTDFLSKGDINANGILASLSPCYYASTAYADKKLKSIRPSNSPWGSFKFVYCTDSISGTVETSVVVPKAVVRNAGCANMWVIEGIGDLLTYNSIHVTISYNFVSPYMTSPGIINKDKTITKFNLFVTNLAQYKLAKWSVTNTSGSKTSTTYYLIWNATCSLCIENINEHDSFYIPFFVYAMSPKNAVTNKGVYKSIIV